MRLTKLRYTWAYSSIFGTCAQSVKPVVSRKYVHMSIIIMHSQSTEMLRLETAQLLYRHTPALAVGNTATLSHPTTHDDHMIVMWLSHGTHVIVYGVVINLSQIINIVVPLYLPQYNTHHIDQHLSIPAKIWKIATKLQPQIKIEAYCRSKLWLV